MSRPRRDRACGVLRRACTRRTVSCAGKKRGPAPASRRPASQTGASCAEVPGVLFQQVQQPVHVLGAADLWPSEIGPALDSLEQVFLTLTEREHLTVTQHEAVAS